MPDSCRTRSCHEAKYSTSEIKKVRERIAQNDILRRQGKINDAEFDRRAKKVADNLKKVFNFTNATEKQLEKFYATSAFDGVNGFGIEDELITITNDYLIKQREITRETEKLFCNLLKAS